MGTKNPKGKFAHNDDSFMFFDDVDIDEFEDEQFEKQTRGRGKRKSRRAQMVRNRFSDYEGERWLKRQVSDWDNYELDDEEDLSWLATVDLD